MMGPIVNIGAQMARDAVNGAGNAAGPDRKPGARVGPIPVVTIIVVVIVFTVMMLNHTMSIGFFVAAPLICIASIIIGLIVSAAADKSGISTPRGVSQDKLARAKRVESLIMPNCPTCRMPNGIGCDMRVGQGYAVLDEWGTRAHFTRMEIAVKLGFAKRADVVAQFKGQLPRGLNL